MREITLEWKGPCTFLELLSDRQLHKDFSGAGIYVRMRRSSREYLYVGQAGGSPGLMDREIRHYVGSVGLLYYLEPKLTRKRRSTESDDAFQKAISMLKDRARFKQQVDNAFEEMDDEVVYLATCETDIAKPVEALLLKAWSVKHPGLRNKRKEKSSLSASEVTIRHSPAEPGREERASG